MKPFAFALLAATALGAAAFTQQTVAASSGKPTFGTFGMDEAETPVIWWYGAGLDCANGTAWQVGAKCVDGQGRGGSFAVAVGWIGFTWYGSSLCHEMGHYYRDLTTGDPDIGHGSDTFGPGGAVDACVEALRVLEAPAPPYCTVRPLETTYIVDCGDGTGVCRDARGDVSYQDCRLPFGTADVTCVPACG
jgi:hypothetical protein